MENKQRQILSEIQEMSASLMSQLNILQSRVNELERLMSEDVTDQPIEVDMDAMELPLEDIVSMEVPANEVVGSSEPVLSETPAEETPEVEEETPAEETPEVEEETPAEETPEAEEVKVEEEEETPTLVLDAGDEESEVENTIGQKVNVEAEQNPHMKMAVIDALAEHQAWKTDMPGSQVKDIRSGISLNDRVFFINTLFDRDAVLFQNTICALNNMTSLDEAIRYLSENHSDWDLESDAVYRFMMAVRRKIR